MSFKQPSVKYEVLCCANFLSIEVIRTALSSIDTRRLLYQNGIDAAVKYLTPSVSVLPVAEGILPVVEGILPVAEGILPEVEGCTLGRSLPVGCALGRSLKDGVEELN